MVTMTLVVSAYKGEVVAPVATLYTLTITLFGVVVLMVVVPNDIKPWYPIVVGVEPTANANRGSPMNPMRKVIQLLRCI